MLYKVNSAADRIKAHLVHVEVILSVGKAFSLLTVGFHGFDSARRKDFFSAAPHRTVVTSF